MPKSLLFLPVLFIFFTAAAQKSILSGKVSDSLQQSIASGDAILLQVKDSSMLKYTPVLDGSFKFDPVTRGNYILKISCLGFKEIIIPVELNMDKSVDFTLERKGGMLKEVSVTGSKKVFTNNNGNLKVNIENTFFSAIPNTMDLLSKLPAVQAQAGKEDAISIVGKGTPLIYVDNQRVQASYLHSLSVDEIKTIEIINNPSARYEAEGRAVILITKKATKKEGWKVDLTQTGAWKRFSQSRSAAAVSFKRKQLELKFNAQYNYLNLWESNSNNFQVEADQIGSRYRVKSTGPRKQLVIDAGLYYQFREGEYFSLAASQRIHKEPFNISTDSYLEEPSATTQANTKTSNVKSKPYFNTNLNYSKKLSRANGRLFLGGQYSSYEQELTSVIYNSYNDAAFNLSQNRYQQFNIDAWSARGDFEKNFGSKHKMELGASFSGARAKALLDINNYDPPGYTRSDYDYTEENYAAYGQVSGTVRKINYSGGLRLETTQLEGGFKGSAALVNNDYTKLFPRISIGIPLDSNKTFTINYSKSIRRPNYSNLSQITTYINPFFEWSNNINLAPAITEEVAGTLQYRQNSLQIAFYKKNNPIYYSASYNSQEKKFRMIDRNFNQEQGVHVNLTVPVSYKAWTSTNMMVATYNQVKDSLAVLFSTKPYLYVYSNNQFKLPNNYQFFVSGWVYTKKYEGVFVSNSLFAVDAGVSKTLFNKLACTLRFNDIFRSLNYKERTLINSVSTDAVYYDDVREISFTVKYSFGVIKNSKYSNKEINENSGRIK